METGSGHTFVVVGIAGELREDRRVHQVQVRALRADVETAGRVARPAVEALVPVVVGVRVGSVLDSVVAFAV